MKFKIEKLIKIILLQLFIYLPSYNHNKLLDLFLIENKAETKYKKCNIININAMKTCLV